jgi:hypothetical protein
LLNNPTVNEILSPSTVEQHCRALGHRWRKSFWSPTTTLVAFLLQVLDGAKTLRSAVALLLTQLVASGESDLPSADPTAYCQARIRLPRELLWRILRVVSDRIANLITADDKWLGRRVWVVDGSSISMPDTPELQKAFPQPSGQRPGCGFPMAQFVALFCWSTGAVIDLVVDTIIPHELNLVRKLYHHFAAGDVLLADRAYGAYVDIARLLHKGVNCVFRLHQRRSSDFRQGKPLGSHDRLVTWQKPRRWLPSFGISRREFECLPETLTVRLVRITRAPRGFRSRTIVLVTSLLDPIETPADEIRALYRDRWTVELNLRSLKITLGMDVLRSQIPEMVYKEIIMYLLAYNLIRLIMWQAAQRHGRHLHRLSFAGTLHRLRAALPLLMSQPERHRRDQLTDQLLNWIAHDLVPDRPDRVEPRRVKRRPKQYSRLVKPRGSYRKQVDDAAR